MSETQNIEYKSFWHDDYMKWVCGFANAQGGRLYIGKDDNGNTIGVEDFKTFTLSQLKSFHSSRPRNPILAEACFKGSYIDSWGSGIQKITDACIAAGLPPPVMEEQFGGFIVKLFKDRFSEEELLKYGLNERQIKAVWYVKEKEIITNSDYQKLNNCSRATANRDLTEMVQKDIFLFNDIAGAGATYKLKIIAS